MLPWPARVIDAAPKLWCFAQNLTARTNKSDGTIAGNAMLQGGFVIIIALAYIGFLFLVASYGDRRRALARGSRSRLLIYPLSLAIYCTSWTFFGSVGLASRTGFDFLTIYIGPVLMVGLAYPLIVRIVRLAKGQNITSIADFIAARYGKSQAVAATVARAVPAGRGLSQLQLLPLVSA